MDGRQTEEKEGRIRCRSSVPSTLHAHVDVRHFRYFDMAVTRYGRGYHLIMFKCQVGLD